MTATNIETAADLPLRIEPEELESLLTGYGWKPYLVEGSEPELVHQRMAATLDAALDEVAEIQRHARASGESHRRAGR